MSAKYKPLLEVNQVIDHDCGNYYIGEIDHGIYGTIDAFFKEYGLEGKNRLLNTLSYLTYEVERRYRAQCPIDQTQCSSS